MGLTNFPHSPVRIFAARQSAGEVGIIKGKGFPKLILPHLIRKLAGKRKSLFCISKGLRKQEEEVTENPYPCYSERVRQWKRCEKS